MPRLPGAVLAALLATALASASQSRLQEVSADDRRVRDLLVLLDGPDAVSAQDAAVDLVRMGPAVGPEVVAFLRARTSCRALWLASNVLARLQLEPALVETKWLAVAGGDCTARRPQELRTWQEAAFAVVDRPAGIALMTRLLRARDPAGRDRAARALHRLTERLSPGHAEAITATPEIVAVTGEALPALSRVVESTASLETRCAAFDALQRARDLPQDGIRTRARSVSEGVRLDCSRVAAPLTAPEQAEGWRRILSRLDTQPPELASQTTSILLANVAEARPHLVQRLADTNRCRSLALVASVLASDGAAPAEVEAAYVRVLEGKCEGREPFDLALAQGVADAFMRDAAGIARVAALLPHPDREVRRRAARAFAAAFERLGPGEQGRTAGPRDPATIPPMQAALAPLVTLAQTERDETARCHAVRGLLFAQQAVDDGLRAEAASATAGRTLRCLAPPPR
jgi:hypothetical protein